jgi:integrase
VSKVKNLALRETTYYARMSLPKRLRELRAAQGDPRGQAERWASLKTGKHAEALKLLPLQISLMQADFDREIEELEAAGAVPLIAPTDDHLRLLRERFRQGEVVRKNQARASRPSTQERERLKQKFREAVEVRPPSDRLALHLMPEYSALVSTDDMADLEEEKREILDRELLKHLREQEFVLVSDYIEHESRQMGVKIEPDSHVYKTLARDLLTTWRKELDIARREDRGELVPDHPFSSSGMSAAPAIADLGKARAARAKGEPTIEARFDDYLREKKGHIKATDRQGLVATIRQFVECVGRKPINEYDVDDMAEFKRALKTYPKDAGKRYPGLSFRKTIEQGRRDRHPALAPNTIRSKLSALSAFGKWLESNASGVRSSSFSTSLPERGTTEKMKPFSQADVVRILNCYAFTGCESKQNHHAPGNHKVRGWQLWVMLIAAFTGARLNEITQLLVTDVREEKGILVFDFRALAEEQSLKTAGSARLVPVHPMLTELGLNEFVRAARDAGSVDLFPSIRKSRDGRRSETVSRWFAKFLQSLGLKDSRGAVHRWRHTVTDALRRADVSQYEIATALGHTIDIARMTNGYGQELDQSLPKRLAVIARIEHPGVNWDLLR